jgi:hypothetical protein
MLREMIVAHSEKHTEDMSCTVCGLEAYFINFKLHIYIYIYIYIKVKLSLYGPLRLQEVEAPRTSRESAHEGGKFVSPKHRPPLPPRSIPGTRFC